MPEMASINYDENVIEDISNRMSQGEFLHYMHLHVKVEEEIAAAKDKRKKLRHHMERQDMNLESFDQVRKEMTLAVEVLKERQETLAQYRGWAALPTGAQSEMFQPDEEGPIEGGPPPAEMGYIACMTGLGATSDDNPFESCSGDAGEWHDGWLRGQQELAKQLNKSGPEIGW